MNRIWVLVTLVAVVAACNGAPTAASDGSVSAADVGAIVADASPDAMPDASASCPDAGPASPDASWAPPDAAPAEDSDAAVDAAVDAGSTALHVLFIGNSYTYVNDLPGMLARIAATAGVPPAIVTDSVVQGSATLQDHWDNGFAQARITNEQWTHVVLQGQSVEAATSNDDGFSAAAKQFGDVIIDAKARPTLFVTWARAAGDPDYNPLAMYWFSPDEMQDLITFNYTTVGRQISGSILSCVGEAFRAARQNHPEIVLQLSDYSHPTVAGTYLAASTFYVALTGNPVPAASEVPAGVSLQDAATLREIALVGSKCPDVQLKANVVMEDCGSGGVCPPFDFGVAGTSISNIFFLSNVGFQTAGITDGMTLGPPFAWTSGAYPGGSGTANPSEVQFCSGSLPTYGYCLLSVSYDGTAEGSGALTLNLTDAYSASLVRQMHGSPTTRALLTVSEGFGFFGCTDTTCGNGQAGVFAIEGSSTPLSLVVSNRGSTATTSLGVGTPLSPPFYWGPGGTSGAFPGGSGTGQVFGVAYDYCATQTLGAGQQCMMTVVFSPVAGDTQLAGAVNLAYSDAQGPVSPNANRNVQGTSEPVCPAGASCGGPCDPAGESCSAGGFITMGCQGSPDAGPTWACYLP